VDRQERGGRRAGSRQFLEDDRRVEAREPAAADVLAHVHRRQAQGRRGAQRIDGKDLLGVPARRVRREVLAREAPRGLLHRQLLRV